MTSNEHNGRVAEPATTAPTSARRPADAPTYVPAEQANAESGRAAHEAVLAQEKSRFGGFKFGSAFFGWLTATGAAVLLTALATAIGAVVGLNTGASPERAAEDATASGATGIWGAIVLGVVLLLSYYAGGYVAGRMARFDGLKQGLAVWLWAVVIAVVVAIVAAIAGTQTDMFSTLGGLPKIPVSAESATLAAILPAVGAAVVALVGALLGGLAGMRFHRRVDRVGLDR
ncbi:hypothetical protein [Microbacterium terricola]|uniref:Major facilitator superfamily (MFS) profile domain-containing protein n=1 Tax=Microbacterium terricola TaxID=344163 RepID=A0ABM8E0C3_9MICO|nr:hypothetical protein [Microbacterium terricola]UYK41007.1 hypothetical protein OAU46_05010 [Microbacterium terricola]BDV31236.1 hypothetical protein Microterr_18960 [Microbacterium terricola]